jgi:hypothetical protein
MKKQFLFLCSILVLAVQVVMAQEVPKELENIISSEVNADKTVTFRFYAPRQIPFR